MKWEAIAPSKKKIKTAITELAAITAIELQKENCQFNLVSGRAGALIFLANFRKEFNNYEYDALIQNQIEQLFDDLSSQEMSADLYYGFSGIAYTLQYLQKKELISEEELAESFFDDLDEYVLQAIQQNKETANLELILGNAGIAVYLFNRPNTPTILNAYQTMIESIDQNKILDLAKGNSCKWLTTGLENNQYYCLGMAHGIPAILSQLGGIYSKKIQKDHTKYLLSLGMQGMLNEENQDCDFSFDHTITLQNNEKKYQSRLAWCYGDLSVALGFMQAAMATHNQSWYYKAIDIASKAAQRDAKYANIVDNSICHGSLGVVHIFNRFYQLTWEDIFKEQALFWLDHALQMAEQYQGVQKYHTKTPDKNSIMQIDYDMGLLCGTAGAGLVLLSLISETEPDWDDVLYTNIQTKRRSNNQISLLDIDFFYR